MELLIDLYTDFLIACPGQATCTLLSEVLDKQISHDQFTRLLNRGSINSRYLWQQVKPLCKEIESDGAVLILDDSVEAKPYSKCNGLISYHFDHTVGKTVKGVNFVSAVYNSWEMSLPVGLDFVIKDEACMDKNGKTKYKSRVSKQEMYRKLIRRAGSQLWFKYVLNDSWFASAENMSFIGEELGRYFIMGMKENRKVAVSKEDKVAGKYISIKEASAEKCVRSVYVEQLDFPLLITKQVFKNGDGSTGTLYLAGNDVSLSAGQMTTIYQRRWKVEEYHKSIKSNSAFPNSPTSSVVAQKSHFMASVLATIKLERLKIRHGKNHFALKALLLKNATAGAWHTLNNLNSIKKANLNKAA